MKLFLVSILNRFKEPSSWAAITAGLVAVGVSVDGELLQAGVLALSGLAGVASFFLKEKGNKDGGV